MKKKIKLILNTIYLIILLSGPIYFILFNPDNNILLTLLFVLICCIDILILTMMFIRLNEWLYNETKDESYIQYLIRRTKEINAENR